MYIKLSQTQTQTVIAVNDQMVFNSLLLSILLCSSYIQLSYCSKLDGVTRKDDIPFVKCQLCEKLAKELYEQVHDKQAKISPNKVVFDMCFFQSLQNVRICVFICE